MTPVARPGPSSGAFHLPPRGDGAWPTSRSLIPNHMADLIWARSAQGRGLRE